MLEEEEEEEGGRDRTKRWMLMRTLRTAQTNKVKVRAHR